MSKIIEFLNYSGSQFVGFALPMLLQSAVLIVLLLALDLTFRKKVRAAIRYAVWMLILVKLVLPPSLALPTSAAYWLPSVTTGGYFARVFPTAVTQELKTENPTSNFANESRELAPVDRGWSELSWQSVLFVVWLLVALGVAMRVVWRLRAVSGVIHQSTEAPQALRSLAESCRRQLAIETEIPVRCAAIGGPAICGVLRPITIIPPSLAEDLDVSEMRAVLLHELAHYKRKDLWINHVQIILQVVYWYNPLVWLANAAIRRTREQAVDETVLVEMGGGAQAYSTTLLRVAKLGLERPSAAIGLMGILEQGRGLTERIFHIMNRPLPQTARVGVRGLAAVLFLALVAMPMACRPHEPHPQISQLSTPKLNTVAPKNSSMQTDSTDSGQAQAKILEARAFTTTNLDELQAIHEQVKTLISEEQTRLEPLYKRYGSNDQRFLDEVKTNFTPLVYLHQQIYSKIVSMQVDANFKDLQSRLVPGSDFLTNKLEVLEERYGKVLQQLQESSERLESLRKTYKQPNQQIVDEMNRISALSEFIQMLEPQIKADHLAEQNKPQNSQK